MAAFLWHLSLTLIVGSPFYYRLIFQGELALAFGELLRKLWAPGAKPVAPRMFKLKLASFAPQFSGYNQHDSQVSSFGFMFSFSSFFFFFH